MEWRSAVVSLCHTRVTYVTAFTEPLGKLAVSTLWVIRTRAVLYMWAAQTPLTRGERLTPPLQPIHPRLDSSSLSDHSGYWEISRIFSITERLNPSGNQKMCTMEGGSSKASNLDSVLSRIRCLALRYMRWATSSIAHNLKNRPRLSTVRISRLRNREHRG